MYYTRGNDHLIRIGEELVQQGSVGAIILAGGQGTRLGLNGPKGVFPTTPIKKKEPLSGIYRKGFSLLK